jgi:hypothetical protein
MLTYLVGDQVTSNSDVRMYEVQLQQGCRCVEIDCWDGTDGEPAVLHGNTLTSAIKFRDVVVAVNEYAFVSSPYPVILSLEMHCCIAQQEKIAKCAATAVEAARSLCVCQRRRHRLVSCCSAHPGTHAVAHVPCQVPHRHPWRQAARQTTVQRPADIAPALAARADA